MNIEMQTQLLDLVPVSEKHGRLLAFQKMKDPGCATGANLFCTKLETDLPFIS